MGNLIDLIGALYKGVKHSEKGLRTRELVKCQRRIVVPFEDFRAKRLKKAQARRFAVLRGGKQ